MFWNIFFNLCTINNTTPTNVLNKLGKSNATATKWKNGTIPNGETLLELANYFNVSTDYLLGREEKSTTNINTATHSKFDNSTVIGVNNGKQYDETTAQVAEAFSNLDFLDKAKVMNLIAELSDK